MILMKKLTLQILNVSKNGIFEVIITKENEKWNNLYDFKCYKILILLKLLIII